MSYSFIPSLHYENSETKLTPAWCKKAKNFYYDHTNNRHLLDGKNIDEIHQYATGDIDMRPFKKMYKSIKDTMEGPNKLNTSKDITKQMQFEPLPMIPSKINAAISQMQKIPVEIWCRAIDALAIKKKKEDIEFLKNNVTRIIKEGDKFEHYFLYYGTDKQVRIISMQRNHDINNNYSDNKYSITATCKWY